MWGDYDKHRQNKRDHSQLLKELYAGTELPQGQDPKHATPGESKTALKIGTVLIKSKRYDCYRSKDATALILKSQSTTSIFEWKFAKMSVKVVRSSAKRAVEVTI